MNRLHYSTGMARTAHRLLFSILFIATAAFAGDPPPQRKKVLITYFEPFDGAKENASEVIAKQISADRGLGVDIEICRLPVVYDQAGEEAKKCFEKSDPKPGYVISLGEFDCNLKFETGAHNRDMSPNPDNQGELREGKVIDPTGPTSVPMSFPIDEVLCGSELTSAERSLIVLSASPGGFVCNNTAFTLARYFRQSTRSPRYGFVHVPSHDCATHPDPALSSGILKKYIKQVVASDTLKYRRTPELINCAGHESFPDSLNGFIEKITSLKEVATRACREAYLLEALKRQVTFQSEEKFPTPSR